MNESIDKALKRLVDAQGNEAYTMLNKEDASFLANNKYAEVNADMCEGDTVATRLTDHGRKEFVRFSNMGLYDAVGETTSLFGAVDEAEEVKPDLDFKAHLPATASAIAKKINIDASSAKTKLDELVKEGEVVKNGKTYSLAEEPTHDEIPGLAVVTDEPSILEQEIDDDVPIPTFNNRGATNKFPDFTQLEVGQSVHVKVDFDKERPLASIQKR